MDAQNQIKRVLSAPSSIEYVRGLLEAGQIPNRTILARVVCEHFKFYDTRGKEQLAGCLKALRKLEASGHFTLPAVCTNPTGQFSPKRLSEPVPLPEGVPLQAGKVQGLELALVTTSEQMRIWNEMMINEHPQGAGPLVGRQLRYLIASPYGWLGGFGFAASALNLADRDKWIGWDHELRRKYLHFVVGMNRFLIRPNVHCHNLASKLLSMCMTVMPDDFERQYNYRPFLIESFVDTEYFSGACYQAANWILVGKTKGRGRQGGNEEYVLSSKKIFMYPIEDDFRRKLGLPADAGLGALGPADGLDADKWAENEFGGAPLGDKRRSKRLVDAAKAKAESPGRAFSGVAEGDWPKVKGYYRLIDLPEDSEFNMSNILAPHQQRTVQRIQGQRTVLCVQDGSDLDYTNLNQCEGLGETTANQTGAKRRGLHLHSMIAVAPNGLPLGVLRAQCDPAKEKLPGETRPACAIPIEEKKTFVWIENHRYLVELSAQMPNTRLLDVCDREADFFEMFNEHRQKPSVDLLIRAKHDRTIGDKDPSKMFATVREEPVQSRIRVHIPRQSARPKKSKQKARPKRAERTSDLALRYMRIQIRPPHYHADKEPIDLWLVHALEENPPNNEKPIEWFLLTSVNIATVADAEQCLRWYCLRWRIEDWHRVLKSGCRIENLAHKTAERLRRAIAINLVIAWRIMLMTLLGRETPELPAEILFSDIELRTLKAYAKKKGMKPPIQLGEAVRLVAKIGGYLGRTNDPPPGHQLIWMGYLEFRFMCMGFELLAGDE